MVDPLGELSDQPVPVLGQGVVDKSGVRVLQPVADPVEAGVLGCRGAVRVTQMTLAHGFPSRGDACPAGPGLTLTCVRLS